MQAFSGIMSITGSRWPAGARRRVLPRPLHRDPLRAGHLDGAAATRQHGARAARGRLIARDRGEPAPSTPGYLLTGAMPRPLGSGTRRCRPTATSGARTASGSFIAAANDRFWRSWPIRSGATIWPPIRASPPTGARQHRAGSRRSAGDHRPARAQPLLASSKADVPATPVNTVDQVMNDPQTIERGIVQRAVHPRLGRSRGRHAAQVLADDARRAPRRPLRGEHTGGSWPSAATRQTGSRASAPGRSSSR